MSPRSETTAPGPPPRRAGPVAAGAASVLLLTSCAVLTAGDRLDNVPHDVSTDITDEPVELVVAYTDDPPVTELVEGFTELHPNVSIELQQTPFSDYIKTVTLAMSSEDPPDLAQYNPGAMRSLVPGGYVLDLDPYSEAYGWEGSFPAASLEPLRADEDAARFGEGSLYAAPGALSVIGVFYNRELLAKAGVEEPPAPLDEFEEALERVAAAGIVPFDVGGLGVGGIHLWNALLNAHGDGGAYRDWVHGVPDSTIETPSALEATRTFTRWVEAGYVPASANATSDDDARADFATGSGAFLVTGNWAAFELDEAMGENVGFFPMPGVDADQEPLISGSSVSFVVSSQTEHPDVAAAFLDHLSSPESARIQLGAGFMPVDTDVTAQEGGVLEEINTAYTRVAEEEGIVPFPDFVTPGMIDRLTPGAQGLTSGTLDEEAFLAEIQTEWDRVHGR
ncbi:ABC transporter substrate-binding protein [Nocardiopsis alba]|uniref:ABC transporter substrate-binding protein n=1 Tax=Nocardiopsis alba TaxID=53437 RepID=UPI00380DFD68